jgi:hypothetical protein
MEGVSYNVDGALSVNPHWIGFSVDPHWIQQERKGKQLGVNPYRIQQEQEGK